MKLLLLAFTVLIGAAGLISCERNYDCRCEQTIVNANGEFSESVYHQTVKAKNRMDASSKCFDLSYSDFGDPSNGDPYYSKDVYCKKD